MGRAAKKPLNKKKPAAREKMREQHYKAKRKTKQRKHIKLKSRDRNKSTSETQSLESIKETLKITVKANNRISEQKIPRKIELHCF